MVTIFLHLACISNDSSFELNEDLSKTINYDCFEPMVIAAKSQKLKDLFMHPVVQFMEFLKKKMLKRS